jgi:inorganic phosphate transporter, PiT family
MSFSLILVILLALFFDLLNGIRDSSNIVATMISSRALSPRWALTITAVAEFLGPFIFGVALARTIGDEIVIPGTISMVVIISALISAIFWNVLTWYLALPSSSSHALIGGIIGAVVTATGWEVIQLAGIEKILIALFASPIIGFVVGYLFIKIVKLLCWRASPKVNIIFKRGQIFTAIALALSHGTNDAQKSMGIITLGLVTAGYLRDFVVPFWVIVLCASMISLGTSIGGWRLIKTLGSKFYKIRPIDGFSIQLSSAFVILGASLFGGPVSTTQVVSTAIMGVGAAERVNKVRWGIAGEIGTAWFLTIPATAMVASGIYWLITSGVPALIQLF